MVQMQLSKNMEKFRNSLFVNARVDPFYLFMFAIGAAIALIYPASMWIGVLAMATPLIPVINRVLFGDRQEAFYEDFDDEASNAFIRTYTRFALAKGLSEHDIASDVYTLKTVWATGDGAATMISLMHFANKIEALSDVSDIQQTILPSVHPGEDDPGTEGSPVSDENDGSGLPARGPSGPGA